MPAGLSNAARRLASPQMQARFGSRFAEFAGLLLGIAGISLALALVTYSPVDPSFDTATTGPVRNIAGHPGADIADLLLQWFGLGGALPAVCLLAWAWRIASHRGLEPVTLRIAALFASLPAASGVAAAVPILVGRDWQWPSPAGPGGAVGSAISSHLIAAGTGLLGPLGGGLVTLVGVVLTAMLVALAFGLSAREWGRGVGGAASFLSWPARAALGRRASGQGSARRRRAGRPAARAPVRGPAEPYAIELGGDPNPHHLPAPSPGLPVRAPQGEKPRAVAAHRDRRDEPARAAADGPAGRSADAVLALSAPRPAALDPGPRPDRPPTSARAVSDPARPLIAPVPGPTTETPQAAPAARAPSRFALGPLRRLVGRERDPDEAAVPPAGVAPPVPRAVPRLRAAALFDRAARNDPPPEPAAAPSPAHWRLPPLDLLRAAPARAMAGPSPQLLEANARLLETVLADYGVQGAIRDIRTGPVVSLYELEPAPGIRSARVIGLADDVARSLSVTAVRIATVPGRNVIGIEVPNAKRETVYLSELLGAREFETHPARLVLALGKDISGAPILADLARMPHLLIAGTTGSGKSVGVNAMIASLLYRLSPDECRLILIDPKMLELSVYDGIPHLMAPVVTEPKKAVTALKWTVREMERRYRAMSQLGVRNVAGYNEKAAEARARGEVISRRVQTGFDSETGKPTYEEQRLDLRPLPFLVVVIDEMADLMMVAGKEIEAAVQRLAQMARAAGIHVIMATQRPSVDVITGTIKANFPTRISFQVISKFDSRTILGEQGAEQLLGQGDMLHMQAGGRIGRIHGPFVGDEEVEEIVAWLKTQGVPDYLDEVTEAEDDEPSERGGPGARDAQGSLLDETSLFDQAVAVVAREGKASTSFIQRHLSIGYNRAAKLIEQMEKEGIVGPANHVGKREILVRRTNDED